MYSSPVAPSTAYSFGRAKSSRRVSQSTSSVRCCSSIAQPSVTALSPSRFSSIERSREVCAKCSVCPPSWKSARQSSGPPIGRVEEVTALRGELVERARRQRLAVQLEVVVEAEVSRTLLHHARGVEV